LTRCWPWTTTISLPLIRTGYKTFLGLRDLDGQWHRVVPGGVLDIKGGEKHAWRNNSSEETRLLFVTTMRMKHFFDEIARPVPDVPAPPSPEVLSRMFEVAHRYGYWLATPQENLQIGLAM
jgi:hypothetical protein